MAAVLNYTFESESEVAQLCPSLCHPMDCSLPGSSVHGIFQATILEWAAISFSRGSSQPRDQTQVSRSVGRCFYHLSHQGSQKKNYTFSNFKLFMLLFLIELSSRHLIKYHTLLMPLLYYRYVSHMTRIAII